MVYKYCMQAFSPRLFGMSKFFRKFVATNHKYRGKKEVFRKRD